MFVRFETAEDCQRWSAAVAEIGSSTDGPGLLPQGPSGGSREGVPPFLEQLAGIPAGTELYDVFACPSPACASRMVRHAEPSDQPPSSDQGSFLLRVGVVRTTSRFVRSTHRLAFRHQRKEEDYARKPQWVDQLDPLHLTIGHSAFEGNIRAGRYSECG
jgi:hypothetical protein